LFEADLPEVRRINNVHKNNKKIKENKMRRRFCFGLVMLFLLVSTRVIAEKEYLPSIPLLLLNKNNVPTVTSAGQVWMDRNLGASRVATSMDDEEAYGDLYQWGRGTDGHEKRTSGTTSDLSGDTTPGHGDFILSPSSPRDWLEPHNGNLWQPVSGINNPCPAGFRLPTETEWETERASWSSNNGEGAFASPLRLVLGGFRSYMDGTISYAGSSATYWSSSTSTALDNRSRGLAVLETGSYAQMGDSGRANGRSVRCIMD
jgi:uncharacterized protein (TIGR02145 family)